VAVKIVLPEGGLFDARELCCLARERAALEMLAARECEHAASLAAGALAARVAPDACWFVTGLLRGESLRATLLEVGPLDDAECVAVARDVLAALKALHCEGLVHRDVRPANIVRSSVCRGGDPCDGSSYECAFVLIDFGAVAGVDDRLGGPRPAGGSTGRRIGDGAPEYMAPEAYRQPERAHYPADLWSLGATLFELATCRSVTGLVASKAVVN
jgi:serine/threonine protein kinase